MIEQQTVAEFIAQSDLIKNQVDESLKLVNELRRELAYTRETMVHLKVFAPNSMFTAHSPSHLRVDNNTTLSMQNMLEFQITRINNLLGDKR